MSQQTDRAQMLIIMNKSGRNSTFTQQQYPITHSVYQNSNQAPDYPNQPSITNISRNTSHVQSTFKPVQQLQVSQLVSTQNLTLEQLQQQILTQQNHYENIIKLYSEQIGSYNQQISYQEEQVRQVLAESTEVHLKEHQELKQRIEHFNDLQQEITQKGYQIEQLKAQIALEKEKNAYLLSDCDTIKDGNQKIKQQCKLDCEKLKNEIQLLQINVENKDNLINENNLQLTQHRQCPAKIALKDQEIIELKCQIQKLLQINENLKEEQESELQKISKKVSDQLKQHNNLQTQLQELQEENKQLIQSNKQKVIDAENLLQKTKQQFTQEITILQSKLDAQIKETEEKATENKTLKKQLAEGWEEQQTFKSQLQQSKQFEFQCETLKEKLKDKEQLIHVAQTQNATQESVINELKDKLVQKDQELINKQAELQSQIMLLQQQAISNKHIIKEEEIEQQMRLTIQPTDNVQLQCTSQILADSQVMQQQIIHTSQQQNNTMITQMQEQSQKMLQQQEQLFQNIVKQLQEQNENLMKEVKERRSDLEKQVLSGQELQNQVIQEKQQHDALQSEIQVLQQNISQKECEISNLTGKVALQKDELVKIQASTEQLSDQHSAQVLKSKEYQLQAELLQKEIEFKNIQIAEQQAQIRQCKDTMNVKMEEMINEEEKIQKQFLTLVRQFQTFQEKQQQYKIDSVNVIDSLQQQLKKLYENVMVVLDFGKQLKQLQNDQQELINNTSQVKQKQQTLFKMFEQQEKQTQQQITDKNDLIEGKEGQIMKLNSTILSIQQNQQELVNQYEAEIVKIQQNADQRAEFEQQMNKLKHDLTEQAEVIKQKESSLATAEKDLNKEKSDNKDKMAQLKKDYQEMYEQNEEIGKEIDEEIKQLKKTIKQWKKKQQ